MSFEAVPTLEQLAIQVLASDEDRAVAALKDLPIVFFPPLFKEAFIQRRKKLVKHMVTTWPHENLYIGPLMGYFDVDTFKAVLDGVDWLSGETVRPRRCKLKELNLVNLQHDFLEIWTPTRDLLRVPRPQSEQANPSTTLSQPLSVHADYVFLFCVFKAYHEEFMQWVRQRLNTFRFSFYRLTPKRK